MTSNENHDNNISCWPLMHTDFPKHKVGKSINCNKYFLINYTFFINLPIHNEILSYNKSDCNELNTLSIQNFKKKEKNQEFNRTMQAIIYYV